MPIASTVARTPAALQPCLTFSRTATRSGSRRALPSGYLAPGLSTFEQDSVMAKKRASGKTKRSTSGVSVERARSGQGWTLVHPPCGRESAEDLDEVREMIGGGESDVAIDELR